MKPIINSVAGFIILCIAAFFVFALQGMALAAVASGIFAVIGMSVKCFTIRPVPNPVFSPSRSQMIKNRRRRLAH